MLDLGAGWGRDARYFADHGFAVTAVDNRPAALASLQSYRAKKALRYSVISADIRDLPTSVELQSYDVVLCRMVLHFLRSRAEVASAIAAMQRMTNPSGINVVSLFTDRNPVGLRPYLAKPGELPAYYAGWRIVDSYEGLGRWLRPKPGALRTRHYVTRLTAQRVT